ncbi:MAG TPA: PaaI family thioesterase [Candidatus Deferrimicrobiaceae bacterium]
MTNDDREYLPHSSGCFLCGDENVHGVRTAFFVEEGAVRARLSLPAHVNGYKGIAHGGVVAALLDETMGWAATVFGDRHPMYVTAELTLKYLGPIPVGEPVEIVGRLVEDAGRIAYTEGELLRSGKVLARAKGKFMPMTDSATAGVMPYLKFDRCRAFASLFGRNAPG